MARSYLCLCVLAAVSVIARYLSPVGVIFVRAIETIFVESFPARTDRFEPEEIGRVAVEQAVHATARARVLAYAERRRDRVVKDLPCGRGLLLAA